jgi:Uma2 family endonuclease
MGMPVPKMPADWEWEPTPDNADDPFRYGWRPRLVHLAGGKTEEQRIPLTAADLLDPQLGDEILTQGGPHATLATDLYDLVKRHFKQDDSVLVTFDRKIRWGIPGLPEPSPDMAVIRGVRDRAKAARSLTFDVPKEGVRPCLIVEVVSPQYEETRDNDYVAKVKIYERAGIPEYVILESSFTWKDHILLTGYRLGPDGHYRSIEPAAHGRLLSETAGLLFGEDEDGSVLVIDARTGERLRKPTQLEADEESAKKRAAREAKARRAAEKRATQEAQARKAAEERLTQEAEARKAAEAEIARLRAELDRISRVPNS